MMTSLAFIAASVATAAPGPANSVSFGVRVSGRVLASCHALPQSAANPAVVRCTVPLNRHVVHQSADRRVVNVSPAI